MTFLQVEVLNGHKAVFSFEDSANATSHFGERVSGAKRPKEDDVLPKRGGSSDGDSKSGEMQLSN